MKYKVIYADPPWSYDLKVGQGIADDEYKTMPLEEIKALPIRDMADENAVLFLWVTFPMLQEGLEVIKAWGFQYKTCAFNWIKLNSDGTPFFGIGHYTKSNSELCLLAVKGKVEIKSNKVSQVIMSQKDKHSKKPYEAYSKIELMYGDIPRIELFARHKRQGWEAWGNQVPKEEQRLIEAN
jgi:site-specific DNA-methyltransferase (adenine-specific)